MSNIPADLRYASTHEWVRPEGGGVFTIGISDHAQQLLGDMVFVELPDVYAPISGEILEVNADLEDAPELVNSDPYGEGWLFKIRAKDPKEVDGLFDAEAYEGNIEDE
jgi:glycine cleavage system H protein